MEYSKSSVILIILFAIFTVSWATLDKKRLTSPYYPRPYPNSYFSKYEEHYSDSKNNRIRILVKKVQLHPSDYLNILDSKNDCGFPLAQFYGYGEDKYFPLMFFSITERICIRFHNYYGGYPGYEIDIFEFPRCNGDLTDEYGDIVSPNYDHVNYDADSDCEWRIQAPKGQGVQFNVEELSVNCDSGDDVIINGGVGSLCSKDGLTSTDLFVATTSPAIVKFKSSKNSRNKGFWIKYKMVGCPEPTVDSQFGSLVNPAEYYPIGYTVNYKCPIGLWYSDSMRTLSATCRSSGKWLTTQEKKPCKPVTCGDPGTPSNARRHSADNTYHYQQQVFYECNLDYMLVGSAVRTCGQDGKWIEDLPTCKGIITKCDLPPDPEFGFRISHNTSFGDHVTFGCMEGYRLVGEDTIVCQTTGKWSGNSPTCHIVECEAPSVPANGTIVSRHADTYHYEDYVEFACLPGFRMITAGNGVADCLSNGTWDEEPPTCQAISCSEPTVPVNGRAIWNDTIYGAETRYECFQGYTLDGAVVSKCDEFGWTSTVPRCNPVPCPAVRNDSLANAYVISDYVSKNDVYHFGQSVQITCDYGYSLTEEEVVPTANVTCNHDGKWNWDPTEGCRFEIHCPSLENHTALVFRDVELFLGNSTTISSAALIHCINSGRIVQVQCSDDGAWNPKLVGICEGDDGSFDAKASTKSKDGLDLWLIVLIVLGSVVLVAIIGLIIIRSRKNQREKGMPVAATKDNEYDNPIYGVNTSGDDQLIIGADGQVGFSKGDTWQRNPTYHNAAQTLQRPDSTMEESLYGNANDLGYANRQELSIDPH